LEASFRNEQKPDRLFYSSRRPMTTMKLPRLQSRWTGVTPAATEAWFRAETAATIAEGPHMGRLKLYVDSMPRA